MLREKENLKTKGMRLCTDVVSRLHPFALGGYSGQE